MCVEAAPENIGWNGGPGDPSERRAIDIREQSLFRFCNGYDLAFAGTDLVVGSQQRQYSPTLQISRLPRTFRRPDGRAIFAAASDKWRRSGVVRVQLVAHSESI